MMAVVGVREEGIGCGFKGGRGQETGGRSVVFAQGFVFVDGQRMGLGEDRGGLTRFGFGAGPDRGDLGGGLALGEGLHARAACGRQRPAADIESGVDGHLRMGDEDQAHGQRLTGPGVRSREAAGGR